MAIFNSYVKLPEGNFWSYEWSQMLHGAGIFTYIYPKHSPVL